MVHLHNRALVLPRSAGSAEAFNRVEVCDFSADNRTITLAEKVQGNEVSRRYLVFGDFEQREIACAQPGAALNDPANSITVTRYQPGLPEHKPASVLHPDGTLEAHTYDAHQVLLTSASGQPDATETNVLNGTLHRVVRDPRGLKVTEETRVVTGGQEGLQIAWQETAKDAFGRALSARHLNGTQTAQAYDCCGVNAATDAEGSVTAYSHDTLKRLQSVARHNIVTSYRYDADHRLGTDRQGTNGTVITLESALYDLAGRPIQQVNALNGTNRIDYAFDAANQSVVTTTAPNGGTRVETYYQDGTLQSLTGTAVAPVRYEYGVKMFNAVSRAFTREIKLDAQLRA